MHIISTYTLIDFYNTIFKLTIRYTLCAQVMCITLFTIVSKSGYLVFIKKATFFYTFLIKK